MTDALEKIARECAEALARHADVWAQWPEPERIEAWTMALIEKFEPLCSDKGQDSRVLIEAMADAIDAARYAHPTFPRERPRPFSEADEGDREYALRLARAAAAAAPAPPQGKGNDGAMRERALQIIATEERLAAKDDPADINLHVLRLARVGTAQQILGTRDFADHGTEKA